VEQTKTWMAGTSPAMTRSSPLRLRRGSLRPGAAFGHELIELGPVLGETQALEELDELALPVFEPAQGFPAKFVESAGAARGPVPAPRAAEAFVAVIVPAPARVRPTSHASSPYEISEDQKPDRPVDHEAQDHQGDPDRLRDFVEPSGNFIELRGDIHGEP